MKKALFLVVAMVISLQVITAQNTQVKKNPVGSWKFEAPYAPEGYNSGFIIVGLTGQKYSTTMSFTGSESKLIGEKVKAVNDSILFSVFLEGQDIKVMLKIEDNAKMTGKAVYSEGEVPLALTKNPEGGYTEIIIPQRGGAKKNLYSGAIPLFPPAGGERGNKRG